MSTNTATLKPAIAATSNQFTSANLDPNYLNGLKEIYVYYYAIANQNFNMPNPPAPLPAAYTNLLTNQFPQLQTDSQIWTNSIQSQLTSVPQEIYNANADIVNALANTLSDINQYITDVSNNAGAGTLQIDISNIQSDIPPLSRPITRSFFDVNNVLNGTNGSDCLNSFLNTLQNDYNDIQASIQAVLTAEGTEQSAIDTLNTDMTNINTRIAQLKTTIGYDDAAIAASVVLMVIGIATFLCGGFILLAGGIACTDLAVAKQIEDDATLAADEAQYNADATALWSDQQDLAFLISIQAVLQEIENEDSLANQGLQYLITQWTSLYNLTTTYATQYNQLVSDLSVSSPDGQTILADLNAVQTTWGQIMNLATTLYASNGPATENADNTVTIQLPTWWA